MGDGYSKKTKTTFFILILLLISIFIVATPESVKSNIQLWPAKLEIEISNYPDDEIQYKKISITNPEKHEVTVRVDMEHPPAHRIHENYSYIPDLSWVKVTPEILDIPPKSTGFFTVHIDIPKKQRSRHYNEKWEVWAIFNEKIDGKKQSDIRLAIASKIRITTPSGEMTQRSPYNIFIILFVIGGLFLSLILIYLSKGDKKPKDKKTAVYFFRKKKNKPGNK